MVLTRGKSAMKQEELIAPDIYNLTNEFEKLVKDQTEQH